MYAAGVHVFSLYAIKIKKRKNKKHHVIFNPVKASVKESQWRQCLPVTAVICTQTECSEGWLKAQ